MSMSANIHCHAPELVGNAPLGATAYENGSIWLAIENGRGDRVAIFLPDHPDAFEAAQAMALAFNSLSKPADKPALALVEA